MMPLGLFASKSFVGLTLLPFLLYGAFGALFVLVPYLLIEAAGYTAIAAGAALLPLPLVLTVTSPAASGRDSPSRSDHCSSQPASCLHSGSTQA